MMRHGLATVVLTLIVAAAHGQSQTRPPGSPAAVAASGAISGTVKDGVTGRPLAGVVVALRAAGARVLRQLTDARGRFVFRDLPPADSYTISTTRMGYVEGAYGQAAMLGPTGRIALKKGQWFAEANILMWRPGAISGRVLDEYNEPLVGVFVRALVRQPVASRSQLIAGPVAVTDDRGEYRIANLPPGKYLVHVPSVQATVPTDPAPDTLGGGAQAPAGAPRPIFQGLAVPSRTDAALDPVASSRLLVGNYATPPPPVDGRGQAYPMTFYPTGSSVTEAQSIDIGFGEERRGIDVAVRPVPTSRIFGTVQGPADALAGLVLRLMPAGLEDLSNGGEAATALVGMDGRFAFLNVPAGAYIIDATRSPFELTYESGPASAALPQAPGTRLRASQSGSVVSGPPGTGYIWRSGQGDDLYWTRTPVSIDSSDLSNLVVTLNRSVTLAGRIIYDGTARVTIESVPLGGARGGDPPGTTRITETTPAKPDRTPTIYAEPADGRADLGLPRSMFLPDGAPQDTFVIEGLKGGEYVLRVPSFLDRFTIKSITIDGIDYMHKPIDASRLSGRVEVVMTLTDKVIEVSGLVHDDRGLASHAAVIAFPVERDQWIRYGLTPLRIKATPVAGTTGYTIRGLPAGDYYLVAVDDALVTAWQDPNFLEKAVVVASRVRLEWGETKSVSLKMVQIK